ncbi:hypothetical protein BH11PSE13_BH11PSE13_01670 [soil metagenome]
MLDRNSALYRRHEDERTRPAQELLAQRFPDADMLGTDNAEAMLVSVRDRLSAARFQHPMASAAAADIVEWVLAFLGMFVMAQRKA